MIRIFDVVFAIIATAALVLGIISLSRCNKEKLSKIQGPDVDTQILTTATDGEGLVTLKTEAFKTMLKEVVGIYKDENDDLILRDGPVDAPEKKVKILKKDSTLWAQTNPCVFGPTSTGDLTCWDGADHGKNISISGGNITMPNGTINTNTITTQDATVSGSATVQNANITDGSIMNLTRPLGAKLVDHNSVMCTHANKDSNGQMSNWPSLLVDNKYDESNATTIASGSAGDCSSKCETDPECHAWWWDGSCRKVTSDSISDGLGRFNGQLFCGNDKNSHQPGSIKKMYAVPFTSQIGAYM